MFYWKVLYHINKNDVTVLKDNMIYDSVEFPTDKDITLYLNDHVLTMTQTIVNKGTLTIVGGDDLSKNSIINNTSEGITNKGILNLNKVDLETKWNSKEIFGERKVLDISAKKLDVTKAGKYEVVLEVWDSSDNVVEVSYIVEVVSTGSEDLEDAVAANKQAIDELYDLVVDRFDDLDEAIEAGAGAAASCAMPTAAVVQLLAASSLLVVFLRKRH